MKNYRAIKGHFINSLIWRGKKITAENFFVSMLVRIKSLLPVDPLSVFYYSSLSLRPLVFLRLARVGSVTYRVPAPISSHYQRLYAIKFLFQASRDTRGLLTIERLVRTLVSIYLGEKNPATEKKFLLYKEAADNRSFINKLKF